MNKKGYATLSTLIIVLIASSLLLLLFFDPILNTTKNIAQSSKVTGKLVDNNSGKERLYSLLHNNVSYENSDYIDNVGYVNEAEYEDLNLIYNIKTLDEEYTTKELNFTSTSADRNIFLIDNGTYIQIELIVETIDSSLPKSYDVMLMLNDEDMLLNGGLGLQVGSDITIPYEEIYNKQTGVANYGDYELVIQNAVNCRVTAVVVYEQLDYRELSIKNKDFIKTVIIEIDKEMDDKTIKFD